MGLMGFLIKVAVECFDVLAWPLFALGYPLCASIQAIETNSHSNTQKLITYWVCFSLILLYEHAFAKLLEWFPSWPYIKLIIVGCLVIPHFDGSFYVYKKFLHPWLSVNPHSVLDCLIKLKEFLKQDNLLVESMREAKESEPDVLENLIAFGSSTAFKPRLEQAKVAKKESNGMAIMEKKEVTLTKQVRQINPDTALPRNGTCVPVVEIKEMTDATAAGRDLVDIISSEKFQKDWSCDVCQDTDLISHVQGKPHEAACKKMETNNQTLFNAKTSASMKTTVPRQSKELGRDIPDKQHSEAVQKMWICSVCQETSTSVTDFVSHIRGKRHVDACEKVKANEQTLKSKVSSTSAADIAPPDSSCLPEKLESSSTRWPWTCAVCQVTVTSKMDLISHFQGRRHEGALEKLKVKIETSRSTTAENETVGTDLPDKLHCKDVQIPWICGICSVTIKGEASLVSHLQGRRHVNACEKVKNLIQTSKRDVSPASVGKKSYSSEEAERYRSCNVSSPNKAKKSRVVEVRNSLWWCTICKIHCNSEGNMDHHLNGSKHLAKTKELKGDAGSGLD